MQRPCGVSHLLSHKYNLIQGHKMVQFLIKRFIGLIFVVLGVTFITFIVGYFAPGDPITQLLGQNYTRDAYLALKHAYGLDLPWYQQYFNFVIGMLHLDFGRSFVFKDREVWDILKDRLPISAELGFWALFLQIVIGVPLGIFSAIKANTWIDTTLMVIMLSMYAVPVFVVVVFVQIIVVQIYLHTGIHWPVTDWGFPLAVFMVGYTIQASAYTCPGRYRLSVFRSFGSY